MDWQRGEEHKLKKRRVGYKNLIKSSAYICMVGLCLLLRWCTTQTVSGGDDAYFYNTVTGILKVKMTSEHKVMVVSFSCWVKSNRFEWLYDGYICYLFPGLWHRENIPKVQKGIAEQGIRWLFARPPFSPHVEAFWLKCRQAGRRGGLPLSVLSFDPWSWKYPKDRYRNIVAETCQSFHWAPVLVVAMEIFREVQGESVKRQLAKSTSDTWVCRLPKCVFLHELQGTWQSYSNIAHNSAKCICNMAGVKNLGARSFLLLAIPLCVFPTSLS